MNISKMIRKGLMAGLMLGSTQFASAAIISFDATPELGNVSDTISVDLVWNGGAGEYLGAFDVTFGFDNAIVDLVSVDIDPLGAVDSVIPCIICGSLDLGGAVNIFEVSLDPLFAPGDLEANQDSFGNTFVLATLEFLAVGNGVTELDFFGVNIFSDEMGDDISPALVNGLICIGPDGCQGPQPVPEPAPFALLLLGLGLLGLRRLA